MGLDVLFGDIKFVDMLWCCKQVPQKPDPSRACVNTWVEEEKDFDDVKPFKRLLFYFYFYFILFYFILFYFILFYFILFYFILFYFILFYFILFYFILFYFILFFIF